MRCLIVDDNELFLEAARALLEREGVAVLGVAMTTAEALAEAERLRPDVILVDISLGPESGFNLARRLAENDHGATVVLISTCAEEDVTDLVADSPATGFVAKSDLSAEAIRRVVDGASGRPGR
jgi:DNA-binding NarL/FixJ family response regulator